MNKAERYISDVLTGKLLAGKKIIQACKRHESDLKKSRKRDFKFYFDPEIANRVIEAFELQRLAIGEKTDQPFVLMAWQAAILWMAYGWRRKDNNRRRFIKCYIKVARGNAKTEFLAGVGNIGFYFENARDPQIYWVATKKEQAKIGFKRQKTMAERLRRDFKEIAQISDTSVSRIYETGGVGYVTYLGKDSKSEDGFSPLYGLIDEYHAHPNDDMIHVIESGMIKSESPFTWIITTAGNNPVCPCKQFEDRAIKMLNGDVEMDTLLAFIFDLDEGDNWEDESNWTKANPGLGISVDLDSMRGEFQKALTEGIAKENNFKTKNLNIWVSSSHAWIKDEVFRAAGKKFDKAELNGRLCFGGLDLSKSRDITCLALFFPAMEPKEAHKALFYFWCPEDMAKERTRLDAVPYMQWAKDGWLTLTPGDIIDYDYIKLEFLECFKRYELHSCAYDRWRESELIPDIVSEIGPVQTETEQILEGFAQTVGNFSGPCTELENMIVKKKLNHGRNPIIEWMNRNVVIVSDHNGNIKFDKAKSKEKIDGMVALAMAVAQHIKYKHTIPDGSSDIVAL